MTARPPRHPRMRAALFAAAGVAAIAIACAMPAPDMVAPKADTSTAQTRAQAGALFDFQVERMASARPSNMPPRYPDALRAAGIEGKVIGKFVVDTTGHADMRSFEVIEANHEGFVAAVREALPNMRFYPATIAGRPVKQLIQMPFAFSLVRGEAATTSPQATRTPQQRVPRQARVLSETPTGDSMPSMLTNVPPVYPSQLRAANIEGQVQAKFVVRADGSVDLGSFVVIRSDHEAFSAAVRRAAESWRFKPATKDGKPVARMITMPFMFSLSR